MKRLNSTRYPTQHCGNIHFPPLSSFFEGPGLKPGSRACCHVLLLSLTRRLSVRLWSPFSRKTKQKSKQYKQSPTQANPIKDAGGNRNMPPVLDYVIIWKYTSLCVMTVSLSHEEIPERVYSWVKCSQSARTGKAHSSLIHIEEAYQV